MVRVRLPAPHQAMRVKKLLVRACKIALVTGW
jgi:hypothetical protein